MSNKTECKELVKNRAYILNIDGLEISALKLEGFKASQLDGELSPTSAGAHKNSGKPSGHVYECVLSF